jgi:hypothetical protein
LLKNEGPLLRDPCLYIKYLNNTKIPLTPSEIKKEVIKREIDFVHCVHSIILMGTKIKEYC